MEVPEVAVASPTTPVPPAALVRKSPAMLPDELTPTALAEMVVALKLPEASRLTMALAMSALVGATFQARPSVPELVMGEPETVKSEAGAVRATLLTEPVPGKV